MSARDLRRKTEDAAPMRSPEIIRAGLKPSRAQRGVTTMEYVVIAAVLVLGLVAGISLFGGQVESSLDTEGQAVNEVARGAIAPVRDRYGDSAGPVGQSGAAAPAAAVAQGGLAASGDGASPEDRVLSGPGGRRNGGGGAGNGAAGGGSAGAGGGDAPAIKTGLGDDVDRALGGSQRLSEGMKALKDKGWKFEFGKDGAGSWCDKDAKKIVIDGSEKGNLREILTTLAHELGHAQYKQDPYVDIGDLTRQQYVDANTMRLLKDEGEAVLTNIEIQRQLNASKGAKIDVAGANARAYGKIYDAYLEHGDRDRARREIAEHFRDNEHPSTDPSKTYGEYYGKTFADYFDSVSKAEKRSK